MLREQSAIGMVPVPRRPYTIAAALAVLSAVTYLPSLNNGFISDDYVILARASAWKDGLALVFGMTPDRFRITSYLAFGLLEALFRHYAAAFYCFTILLHFVNAVLVWRLLGIASGSRQVAVLGAVIFAVGQSPQEGVMWLAAMNEELVTLFIQAALLAWVRARFACSAAACVGALLSKESAPVVLLLLPLVGDAGRRRRVLRWQVLWIAVPVAFFLLAFVLTLPDNVLVTHGFYKAGLKAALVWLISLHRLMFPWLYLALLVWVFTRRDGRLAAAVPGFLWMAAALLPYMFLTYQNHVPSRHTYLASIGFAWALAAILLELRVEKLRAAFISAFIVINIGYIWIVKDRQYELRAAPTSRLIEQLAGLPPGPVLIEAFPQNPWIAKDAARLLPGWNPQMIHVNESPQSCPGCPILRWDPASDRYVANR